MTTPDYAAALENFEQACMCHNSRSLPHLSSRSHQVIRQALQAAASGCEVVTVEDVMDELGIAGTSGYNLIQMIAHAYPNGLKLSKAAGGE